MRGGQSARQWRIIQALEASPNGLTVTEIMQREETGFWTTCRDLETIQGAGFALYAQSAEKASAGPSSTASNSTPLSFTKM